MTRQIIGSTATFPTSQFDLGCQAATLETSRYCGQCQTWHVILARFLTWRMGLLNGSKLAPIIAFLWRKANSRGRLFHSCHSCSEDLCAIL